MNEYDLDELAYLGETINEMEELGTFLDLLEHETFLLDEEAILTESAIRRRVSSSGKIKRVLSREIRKRRAVQTTGRSKIDLRRSARKAARARRRNPSLVRKATRKRRKAMRRRRQMGLKSGS